MTLSSTTTYSSATTKGIVIEATNGATDVGSGIWFNNSQLYAGIGSARSNVNNWGTDLRFFTHPDTTSNQYDLTERMRITSGGFTKMSNDGTYFGSTGTYHEMRSSIADFLGILTNTNSSAPNGLFIGYPNASPNNSDNLFLFCRDGGLTTRFKLQSNGGLANFQANNVNLSDERTKKEIFPLESYWDKFKAIEIVKFKYKDQTHDDFNIGVIAQQVESVAPEFIDIDGWGETPEDDIPLKSVYTADLHHATIKVLQEAMAKIEILEARVQELENK
jgi:hypothetical protein